MSTTTSCERPDSGWPAYRVLLAALLSEGVFFGICFSFGVFQDYYTNKAVDGAGLPHNDLSVLIGMLSSSIAYLGAPLLVWFCDKWPSIPRQSLIWLGWLLCVIGLLASAFTTDIRILIITQGVIFGLGVMFAEMPTLMILNGWFIERRGLAYGLLYGIADLFGVALGFAIASLLHKYGIRTTFITLTAVSAVIPGASIFFLRERERSMSEKENLLLETDRSASEISESEFITTRARYFKQATFYILMAGNLFRSFAYYLPFVYLPSYVTALGKPLSLGAAVLAAANASQIVGEVALGLLSDSTCVHSLALWSCLIPALLTFFAWGLTSALSWTVVYAILFSAFGSGYIVLWPRMGTLFGENDANMIFGFLSFGRGIGAIAAAPISAALMGNEDHTAGFRPLIWFTGAFLAVAAGFSALGWIVSFREPVNHEEDAAKPEIEFRRV